MTRTRKSYLLALLTLVGALLVSTWGTGVSLAQEHDMDHDDDHDMDHDGDHGTTTTQGGGGTTTTMGGGGGDVPPYGPPETGRNPGEQRSEIRYGPFNIPAPGPDEHHGHTGNQFRLGLERPCTNCQLTSITAKMVNGQGEEIGNQQNMQLHHMVLFNSSAGRSDAACPIGYPLLLGERFFASGDERTPVVLPPGYGYPVGTGNWNLIYELANGNSSAQNVYIEMTYDYVDGNTLADIDPVWFDIFQCGTSEVDIGVGQHMRSYTWTVNRPGHVLVAGGHQHGNWVNGAVDGGTHMELRIGGTTGQIICDSEAGYNTSPFYKDGHGAVWLESMSGCGDEGPAQSLGQVSAGQQMTITSHYDHQTRWPGQMGIMIVYISPTAPSGGGPGTTGPGGTTPTTQPGGGEECNWILELLGMCDGNGGTGGGDCFTATNSEHRDAGRAEGFLFLNAVGSGDSLGLWMSTTSLQQSSGGWTMVASC